MEIRHFQGIVEKVEAVDAGLSLVTLETIPKQEGNVKARIPVYMELDKDYEGKPVGIQNVREGFLGRRFEQTVTVIGGGDSSKSVKLPYSYVKTKRNSLFPN